MASLNPFSKGSKVLDVMRLPCTRRSEYPVGPSGAPHHSEAENLACRPGIEGALIEGEWPSPVGPSGMVKTVSRVSYGTDEDWDNSSSPSTSAS
jgi:hypothetical protein